MFFFFFFLFIDSFDLFYRFGGKSYLTNHTEDRLATHEEYHFLYTNTSIRLQSR